MIEVRQTAQFGVWLADLRDRGAAARIDRLRFGNPGVVEPVGAGVSQLKIDYGPGYRVCFVWRGLEVVVLLWGGDKSTQASDIRRANDMAEEI